MIKTKSGCILAKTDNSLLLKISHDSQSKSDARNLSGVKILASFISFLSVLDTCFFCYFTFGVAVSTSGAGDRCSQFLIRRIKEIQDLSQWSINTQDNDISVFMVSKPKGQGWTLIFSSQKLLFLSVVFSSSCVSVYNAHCCVTKATRWNIGLVSGFAG